MTRNLAGFIQDAPMVWWQPADQSRGAHGYWFTSAKLMATEMSEQAARTIYRCFNLVPDMIEAANDRDSLRW